MPVQRVTREEQDISFADSCYIYYCCASLTRPMLQGHLMDVTVRASWSTEMVTAGGRWGKWRMEEAFTHYHASILMTLANTAIKISILMLSRNDCFGWALSWIPICKTGLGTWFMEFLGTWDVAFRSGSYYWTTHYHPDVSYLMMFSLIMVDYPMSFLAMSASKFKGLKRLFDKWEVRARSPNNDILNSPLKNRPLRGWKDYRHLRSESPKYDILNSPLKSSLSLSLQLLASPQQQTLISCQPGGGL